MDAQSWIDASGAIHCHRAQRSDERAFAELVEVKRDEHDNYWPVKTAAKGRFAGKRHEKIDEIAALVTSLTEARKAVFPEARTSTKSWLL